MRGLRGAAGDEEGLICAETFSQKLSHISNTKKLYQVLNMFSYSVFESGDDRLLAICDSELAGKTIKDAKINFHVSKEFYAQKTCAAEGAKNLIKSATIINAVGNKIISLMIREKIIADNVLRISGVPHAQVIMVQQ